MVSKMCSQLLIRMNLRIQTALLEFVNSLNLSIGQFVDKLVANSVNHQ
jgi:hypothetical protein